MMEKRAEREQKERVEEEGSVGREGSREVVGPGGGGGGGPLGRACVEEMREKAYKKIQVGMQAFNGTAH